MPISFSVCCKYCGAPIVISVEDNTAGGVAGICYACSRITNVTYDCSNGRLIIRNVM